MLRQYVADLRMPGNCVPQERSKERQWHSGSGSSFRFPGTSSAGSGFRRAPPGRLFTPAVHPCSARCSPRDLRQLTGRDGLVPRPGPSYYHPEVTTRISVIPPRTIEADELLLRPFSFDDEQPVSAALRDDGILRWASGRSVIEAPEAERARKWLEPRIAGWETGSPVFAVVHATQRTLLGSVSVREVNRLPDQAVLTYWVAPEHRGRGIAGKALDTAARWAFAPAADGGLALHRLTLDHALVNVGSCRVATKAGFRIEGTMRDFYVDFSGDRHDSHLHARLATD